MNKNISCVLCGKEAEPFAKGPKSRFYRCIHCHLIFVSPQDYLSKQEERAHYKKHENEASDLAYKKFLQPFMDALKARISQEAKGLDFGAGKAKPLENWLGEEGYQLASFDSCFFPDSSLLNQRYDFICLTEVLEHLHRPYEVLSELKEFLKPGGLLGVQTRWLPDSKYGQPKHFPQWHYARDPTHVAFYSPASLGWVAKQFGWELELLSGDLAFFRRTHSKTYSTTQ